MTPLELLDKYKHTERVSNCVIPECICLAYYDYPFRGKVCSAHLLDLANVGELEFKWDDYPEVWNRSAILLELGGRKKRVKGE